MTEMKLTWLPSPQRHSTASSSMPASPPAHCAHHPQQTATKIRRLESGQSQRNNGGFHSSKSRKLDVLMTPSTHEIPSIVPHPCLSGWYVRNPIVSAVPSLSAWYTRNRIIRPAPMYVRSGMREIPLFVLQRRLSALLCEPAAKTRTENATENQVSQSDDKEDEDRSYSRSNGSSPSTSFSS